MHLPVTHRLLRVFAVPRELQDRNIVKLTDVILAPCSGNQSATQPLRQAWTPEGQRMREAASSTRLAAPCPTRLLGGAVAPATRRLNARRAGAGGSRRNPTSPGSAAVTQLPEGTCPAAMRCILSGSSDAPMGQRMAVAAAHRRRGASGDPSQGGVARAATARRGRPIHGGAKRDPRRLGIGRTDFDRTGTGRRSLGQGQVGRQSRKIGCGGLPSAGRARWAGDATTWVGPRISTRTLLRRGRRNSLH
jgi:hypothetical protein